VVLHRSQNGTWREPELYLWYAGSLLAPSALYVALGLLLGAKNQVG
jgi:hypothetical protein